MDPDGHTDRLFGAGLGVASAAHATLVCLSRLAGYPNEEEPRRPFRAIARDGWPEPLELSILGWKPAEGRPSDA